MRHLAIAFACLTLAACTTAQTAKTTAAVATSLSTAQSDLNKAVVYYQTGKGIAAAAVLSQPTLAPTIAKVEAVIDPLVATAQIALDGATADAPTIEALAQQILGQVATLIQTAAPAVKVVAGS